MVKRKNKNNKPLRGFYDLKNEINFSEFKKHDYLEKYKVNFQHLCDLSIIKNTEKFEIKYVNSDLKEQTHIVYIMVVEDKILKIGHTIKTIQDRVASYNTGTKKYREKATNSTTNFFILQSMINIKKIVQIYVYFPQIIKTKVFGNWITTTLPPVKSVEKEIIKKFKEIYKKKPIGNIQS